METKPPVPRAILVGVQLPDVDDVMHAASLGELGRLVKTLGYEVVDTVSQKRDEIGGGTVLGKGRLEELAVMTGGTGVVESMAPARKSKARERFDDSGGKKPTMMQAEPDTQNSRPPEFVIVDHELSPSQLRNLERATGAQVLDRTGVIVEIFHRHAHSREAKLQVEIARLNYVAPRLRESSGGGGRQQGRGAGESDLELDRRKIRDRLAELNEQLETIQRDSDERRSARRDQLRVALVGYTNAGKSSLMRALTGSEVLVEDKLFATLDTTVRALQPGDPAARARLGHGRLHQEAAARPGRLVPLHARRGARGVAAAVRRRRLRSDLRSAARGHPHRAPGDRRGRRAVAPAAQQDGPRERGRSRGAARQASRRDPALRASAPRTWPHCARPSSRSSRRRWSRTSWCCPMRSRDC